MNTGVIIGLIRRKKEKKASKFSIYWEAAYKKVTIAKVGMDG